MHQPHKCINDSIDTEMWAKDEPWMDWNPWTPLAKNNRFYIQNILCPSPSSQGQLVQISTKKDEDFLIIDLTTFRSIEWSNGFKICFRTWSNKLKFPTKVCFYIIFINQFIIHTSNIGEKTVLHIYSNGINSHSRIVMNFTFF